MAVQGQGNQKFRNRNELFSVFVGRLNTDVKEKDVLDLFSGCGEVVDHVILPPKTGTTHKYGFMRYLHRDEAFRAIKELNGWPLKSERIIVDVATNCASKFSSGCLPEDLSLPCLKLGNTGSKGEPTKRSPNLDSIINLNRVKEICLWINSELAGTCSTGIVKTERIVKDIDSKGGASDIPATNLKPSGRSALTLTSVLSELEKGENMSSQSSLLSQKVWDSYTEISCKVVELLNDKSLSQGLTKLSEKSRRKAGLVHNERQEAKSRDHSENLPGFNSLLSRNKSKAVQSNPMVSNVLSQSPSKSEPCAPNSSPSKYSRLLSLQQQVLSSSLSSAPSCSSRNSTTPTDFKKERDEHTKTLSSFHDQSGSKPALSFSPCHEQSKTPFSSKPVPVRTNAEHIIPKMRSDKQKEGHVKHPATFNLNSIEDLDSLLAVGQKIQQNQKLELSELECSLDEVMELSEPKEDQPFAEQEWENVGKFEVEDHNEFASNLFCEILDLENDSNPANLNDTDKTGFRQQKMTKKLKIQGNSTNGPVPEGKKTLGTLSHTIPETRLVSLSDNHTKTKNSLNLSSISTHLFQSSNYHDLLPNQKMERNQQIRSCLPTKRPAIAIVRPNSASIQESPSKEVDVKPFGFRSSRLAYLSRFSTPKPGVNIKPPFTPGLRKGFSSDGDSLLSSSSSNTSLSSPK